MTALRTRHTMAAGAVAVLLAGAAGATTFDIAGEIATCNPLACNLAGIGVGDQLGGFVVADAAAAGPNSTFTAADIQDYLLTIETLSVGAADSTLDSATLSTDAAGQIDSGNVTVSGELDAGPLFGLVDLSVAIDATAGTWAASTTLLGLGVFATGTVAFSLAADTDEDGIADAMDNCIEVANTGQEDADGDFYGNACDADLNNDGSTSFGDLAAFKSLFLPAPYDAVADFNSDGFVNFGDLAIFKQRFGEPPGPSGTLPPPVTYAADVQPILEVKCAGCHTGAGFGGHDIGNVYADAFLAANSPSCVGLNVAECSLVRIQDGSMPQGGICTGDPVQDAGNASCLTQEEQDTVQAWIDAGLPE